MRRFACAVMFLGTVVAPNWGASVALAQTPARPAAKPATPAKEPLARPQTPGAKPTADLSNDVVEPVAPTFDHSAFNTLLHAHVKDGLVDYAAFRNNAEFQRYLESLRTASLDKFEEAERIAFWLNVYNAYTIQLVASHGETESIRNIDKTFGLFKLKGPWSETFVKAAGKTLSLDDVEHRVLRQEFSEPRVHFGMNFGAMGSPKLRSEAFTGAQLDEQLDDQGRIFLHEKTKNRVDTLNNALYLSPVIGRYRDDFGQTSKALGKFLGDYFPPGAEKKMLTTPRAIPMYGMRPTPPGPDSAKRARDDSIRMAERIQRATWYFRVIDNSFDWRLNIRKPD